MTTHENDLDDLEEAWSKDLLRAPGARNKDVIASLAMQFLIRGGMAVTHEQNR